MLFPCVPFVLFLLSSGEPSAPSSLVSLESGEGEKWGWSGAPTLPVVKFTPSYEVAQLQCQFPLFLPLVLLTTLIFLFSLSPAEQVSPCSLRHLSPWKVGKVSVFSFHHIGAYFLCFSRRSSRPHLFFCVDYHTIFWCAFVTCLPGKWGSGDVGLEWGSRFTDLKR